MTEATRPIELGVGGIEFHGIAARRSDALQQYCLDYLKTLDFDAYVVMTQKEDQAGLAIRFRLSEAFGRDWAPNFDTTQLCAKLDLDIHDNALDLEREIVLTMLLGPVTFSFPSFDELLSAVRIRKNIVQNARKTALSFDTEQAERPEEYWAYTEQTGFTVLPGKSLITALEKATQPERSGRLYSFSCYRATEYVLLLAIAQELAHCNPGLLARLQSQWETRAIMSGQFHDVFLREYGSMAEPLPLKYYVPGDRLWFRNPDEQSSNVEGYEGSWVMYLGNGFFTNFWKRDQPFTLTTKCVEIYHWRNATCQDQSGKLQVDDDAVDAKVAQSLQNPVEVREILAKMLRLREPGGVYVDGGCIDTTREYARWVRPGTSDLRLPDDSVYKK